MRGQLFLSEQIEITRIGVSTILDAIALFGFENLGSYMVCMRLHDAGGESRIKVLDGTIAGKANWRIPSSAKKIHGVGRGIHNKRIQGPMLKATLRNH